MDTNEVLLTILQKLDGLEQGQQTLVEEQKAIREELCGIREEQCAMRKDIQTLKHDVKEIAWKVDILYDWVDGLELRLKALENRTA